MITANACTLKQNDYQFVLIDNNDQREEQRGPSKKTKDERKRDKNEETNRVKTQGNGNKCSRVVEGRLHRMHVRPGECCRVVRLVVQGVDLGI